MASTKDEIAAISVEHGYTGAAPKTIADAIDVLADTLAGTDVKSGRSIAGAIHALAPYIGSGGGGSERVELFNETVTTEASQYGNMARLTYVGDITDDPLHVIFDGVEYDLPRLSRGDYGVMSGGRPDLSTYPLYLGYSSGNPWTLITETAGTHTIIAYTENSSGGFEPKGMCTIDIGSDLTMPEGDYFLFRVDSRGPLQNIADISSYGNVYSGVANASFGNFGGGLYVALAVSADTAENAAKATAYMDNSEIDNVTRFVVNNNAILTFQAPTTDEGSLNMITISTSARGGDN